MAGSALNPQSDSDKLPKSDGLDAAKHNRSAGEVLSDSDSRKTQLLTATTFLVHPGQRIRDYELLELLGQGGMGSVWKAKHTRLKKFVAVKLLPQEKTSDVAAVARFNREMEAVGALKHPHIIEALDAGEENGTHYLVMEYVAGIELAALSKKVGPFPIADACELMRQTALGLQHAFEHGLVHRDIKPSNLMLARSGRIDAVESDTIHASGPDKSGHYELKILDLGLALLLGDQPGVELTSTGQVMGTLDYIAPEQLADTHSVDIRADLYSLGCTLFRLLTTEPPFAGPSLNTAAKKMFAHSFTPAPKLLDRCPAVPAELSALVARLLAKKPAARFATPREVAIALAPFCVGHNLPALLASSSSVSSPSDPFESTLVLQQNVQASGVASVPLVLSNHHDHREADATPLANSSTGPLHNELEYTEQFTVGHVSNVPVTEHVENVLHEMRRRPWLIVGTLLAIVLLSVFLLPFLKRDASVTETTTTNPGSPNLKSEISNSKSQIPADRDRAAAEWVLSVGGLLKVVQDGATISLAPGDKLPESPFVVDQIDIAVLRERSKDKVIAIDDELARLAGLKEFRELLVLGNPVTDRGVAQLRDLPKLRLLHLDSTQVTDACAESIVALSNLEMLHLGHTKVTPAVLPKLKSLRKLKWLSIFEWPFSPMTAAALLEIPSLRYLDLDESWLTEAGITRLRPMELIGLAIDFEGKLSDERLKLLGAFPQLNFFGVSRKYFSKSDPEIAPSGFRTLADLPRLTDIGVTDFPLNDEHAAAIAEIKGLEMFQVFNYAEYRSPLTDTGLEHLSRLPKLKQLTLNKTQVTPAGLARFRAAKPDCQITTDVMEPPKSP